MNLHAASARQVAKAVAGAVLPSSLLVVHGPRISKRIALTFDDGPSALTPAYLDTLDRYDAKATFFVVGKECRAYPDELAEIRKRGHELGVHGFTHRRFTRLPRRALVEEELGPTAALWPASGSRLVRPPHGDLSLRVLVACKRAGFTTVLWSNDSGDWRTRDASEIVEALSPEKLEPGAIVLLHEGQSWTLDALDTVLRRLKEGGHELVTVGRLLAG